MKDDVKKVNNFDKILSLIWVKNAIINIEYILIK